MRRMRCEDDEIARRKMVCLVLLVLPHDEEDDKMKLMTKTKMMSLWDEGL